MKPAFVLTPGTIAPAWHDVPDSTPPAPAPTTFGALLSRQRDERGWSQSELGRRAGMNHAAISRLESGERTSPRRKTVTALANALMLDGGDRADLYRAAGYMPDIAPGAWPTVRAVMAVALGEEVRG